MIMKVTRRTFAGGLGMTAAAAALPSLAAEQRPFFDPRHRPLGVQLYALGQAALADMDGTLTRLSAMGYTDFELPGLAAGSAPALRAAADKAGVRFGSIHLQLPGLLPPGSLSILSSAQEIADAAGSLSVRHVVLPLPPLPEGVFAKGFREGIASAMASGGTAMWQRTADLLNERAVDLRSHGIALGYHNHNMEFMPLGQTTGWDILLAEVDPALVFLELDLGWVAAAGRDPAEEIARLGRRVRMVHVKDIAATTRPNFLVAQDPVEVGRGMLDWQRILPACAKAGVRHYYVEQEPPFTRDRFESMRMSHDFLAALRLPR